MATGGEPSSALVAAIGSEAVFDHVCGPCSDEQTREAVGFCMDCEDWLCDECFRTHKRPKSSKHHVLMSAEEMKNSTQGHSVVDKCTEKCDRHGGKRIQYFCKDHDFLGCSKCVIESHGACKAQNIPAVSTDAATKTEFQQTASDLETIAKQSNELVSDARKKIALVRQNKDETVKAFRKYKMELVESLNDIEVVLEDKCSKKEEVEMEKLKKIIESCGELQKASLQTKAQLEVSEERGQHCNMFVVMKRNKNKITTMKENIRQAQCLSSVTLYTFQSNLKTSELLESPDGMGKLVEKGRHRRYTDYSKVRAKHLRDISVKSKGGGYCTITGSAPLPGHRLVLTDNNNGQVKVIDTKQNKILSNTKIDGTPWTVCRISDNSVAVTVHNKNRLLFLSVDDIGRLTTTRTIAVSGQCFGIAATDDRIIITYRAPDKMEVMDKNGSVLQTVEANHLGQQVLACPQYISVSPDKKSVYISNYSHGTVTCISLDGRVKTIYKDDELRGPEQTAVDNNGMIYVSDHLSKNVHLITPDCNKIKVVLNASDGLKNVYSMSFCEDSNRLYIGMFDCDVIKVFQIT